MQGADELGWMERKVAGGAGEPLLQGGHVCEDTGLAQQPARGPGGKRGADGGSDDRRGGREQRVVWSHRQRALAL